MADQIQYSPLSALRESPFNPRKAYDDASLQELADSIRTQGVLQPIVIRPLGDMQTDIEVRYEIVFGHRRARAAALAGLERVPCILREMSDEDAGIAQVHENLQRRDVTAMEEADSLARLHRAHTLSADRLAAAVGKSRAWVYGRLKLAGAADDVRKAVTDDGLSPEIALEVARLRGDKLQRMALGNLRDYDGSWCSYRHAKTKIRGLFTVRINADTPFDPADATLAKLAGACTGCSRLAGNDPDLADVLDADVCTDAPCYAGKVDMHTLHQVAQLRAAGHTVITGDDAAKLFHSPHSSWARDHMAANHVDLVPKPTSLADALDQLRASGVAVPAPVYLQHPGTKVVAPYYPDAAVDQLQDAWETLHGAGESGTSTPSAAARAASGASAGADGHPDLAADWPAAERPALDRNAWLRVRRAVLAALLPRPRTLDELRAMALRELDIMTDFGLAGEALGLPELLSQAEDAADDTGDDFDAEAWYQGWISTAGADDLGALLAALAIDNQLDNNVSPRYTPNALGMASAMVALAQRYGVDVLAAARPDQLDNADGCAAGGRTAQAEPVNGDMFGAAA